MNGDLGAAVVGVGVLLWAVFVDLRGPESSKVARWWADHAKGATAGLSAFVVQGLAAAAYGGLYWLAHQWVDGHDPRWLLVPTLPAMLIYAPVALAAMPSKYTGYRYWRADLEEEGADSDDARAIAWLGGPFALVGFTLMLFTIFQAFSV